MGKKAYNFSPEEEVKLEELQRAYNQRTSIGMIRVMLEHFYKEQPEVTIVRTVSPKASAPVPLPA